MRTSPIAERVLSALWPRRPAGPLIVMYHGLGGEDGVAPEAFAEQLDRLSAARRVVPLSEAIERLGDPSAPGLAAITFDDGYRDYAAHAVPALRDRGLHATLFVPAAKIGGHNDWDEGVLARRAILDAGELRALEPDSTEIGAHGASHRRLRDLTDAELAFETGEARACLEAAVGRRVSLFAYPYGQLDDFDVAAERAVETAGFRAACSTHYGRGSGPAERYRLRRVGVEPGDSPADFQAKLDGRLDWVSAKERVGAIVRRLGR